MRKITLVIASVSILALLFFHCPAYAGTSSYTENCSPHFYRTTVFGEVNVTCNLQPNLLNRLARNVSALEKTGQKNSAQIDDIINTLNELMVIRFQVIRDEKKSETVSRDVSQLNIRVTHIEKLMSDVSDANLQPLNPPKTSLTNNGGSAGSVQSETTAHLRHLFPNWYQVVAAYPELNRFLGKGPDNLCMRCETQDDGTFGNCRVAGSPDEPSIREAGEKMGSLMRVYSTDGTPIGRRGFLIPIHFGTDRPAQHRPNFCSMFSPADYLK